MDCHTHAFSHEQIQALLGSMFCSGIWYHWLLWNQQKVVCRVCDAAAFSGQFTGIAAWLVTAHLQYEDLNTTTLQQIGPTLAGGCFSLFISLIVVVVLSYLAPQHYDWKDMRSIAVYNDISKDVWPLSVTFAQTLLSGSMPNHCCPQKACNMC